MRYIMHSEGIYGPLMKEFWIRADMRLLNGTTCASFTVNSIRKTAKSKSVIRKFLLENGNGTDFYSF